MLRPTVAHGLARSARLLLVLLVELALLVPVANLRAEGPPPKRVISDPNPGFSGVWVDTVNDEIVVTDDAHHSVAVYPRTASGPTAPLRQIIGDSTQIDFPTTVVVDPVHDEIWTTMNDSSERALAFSRTANGDVRPLRVISFRSFAPPGEFPSNRSWGWAVDTVNDEVAAMFQRNPGGLGRRPIVGGIAVFDRGTGDLKRQILGDPIYFADPHGIFIDPLHDEIFGTNEGLRRGLPPTEPSITVYDRMASGNVEPLRRVQGPRTGLTLPKQIHVDLVNDEMAVANGGNHSITIFSRGAEGDTAPLRTIGGPRTGLKDPTGVFIDADHDEIVVTNWGNHTITVYPRSGNGDVAPIRTLLSPYGGPKVGLGNPGAVSIDLVNDEFVVTNCVSHPRIATFNRLDNGQVAPKRVIYGRATRIGRTAHGIWVDPVNDEITYVNEPEDSILIFDRLVEGNTPPKRIIQGPNTGLNDLNGNIMVDTENNEIVLLSGGGPGRPATSILVFDRLAEGDASPKRQFSSPDFGRSPVGVWTDPVHDEIYIAATAQIAVFDRLAEGVVGAKRIILDDGTADGVFLQLAVDVLNDEFVVTKSGSRSSDPPGLGGLLVYDRLAEGMVPPKRVIKPEGAAGIYPRGVWVDAVNDEIGMADSTLNDIKVFPRVW